METSGATATTSDSAVEPNQNVAKETSPKPSTVRLQARVSPQTATRFEKLKDAIGAQSNEDVLIKLMDHNEELQARVKATQENAPKATENVNLEKAKHLTLNLQRALYLSVRKLQVQLWKNGFQSSVWHVLFYAVLYHVTSITNTADSDGLRALEAFLETGEIDCELIERYLRQDHVLHCQKDLQSWQRRGPRPTRVKGTPQVKRRQPLRERQERERAYETESYEPETEPLASDNPAAHDRIETTFGEALIE
jgi:hypothetical protein